MENIDNKIESPIINVIEKKNETSKWPSFKKMTAVFVGSLSLTTVGVKVFGAENSSTESTRVPVEISTDTTPQDPDNPDQPPTTDTLAPDQPPTNDTLAPDQPPTNEPPTTTEPTIPQQDIYADICSPMGWNSCGEYNIYDADGNLVNRVVADNSWTPEYIASVSGGGDTGTAEKTQDIDPLAP